MDLQKIHNAFDFYFEKADLGMLTPEEKDALLDEAQLKRFRELFGNPNEYSKGDAQGRMHYAKDQVIHDSLMPFKKQATFTTGSFTAGVYTLPTDYMHLLAMEINISDDDAPGGVTYENVDIIPEDRWAERKKSQLIPVSATRPIARFKMDTPPAKAIAMFPAQGYAGTLYYMKRPVAPVFSYTLGGTGNRVITYSSGGSTQMEWNDTEIMNNILPKALQLAGVNLQAGDVVGFFQQKDAAGV